ncbi:S-adenosylmethionine:tRNA ribosyltransferase-isomerase [Ferruginibacter paludis]|uniref:S-adenosylmethionine:tRNA ribosyltransferase-isomerase n=1 Tax=Ferruginibacter paludis TaxID=1310417 RepID=UPI0025B6163C|nr:S-adenosylmethionine:tRNA ribosyltransferase-isomerase [Ferruginibacter paludis]MDN3658301.1 S-adenosylmethionine:tRNA ribosyltransferase-isomerase [Ferruginibacter paludis]
MHPQNIAIIDYTYSLPEEKIAAFPLADRDASKLLVYKNGNMQQHLYKNIADCLPAESLLVFNNTKVIPARILFQKSTGGIIEIFCLEPYEANKDYTSIMSKKESVRWKCMIGGAGKWKQGPLVKKFTADVIAVELQARLVEKLSDAYVVELSWQPAGMSFAEVIACMGEIPLPPYIKRKAENSDTERYQTIYAAHDGSVAAPTAGLHFTDHVFTSLKEKNIQTAFVTLHVGAGTFKPVKAGTMQQHEMHAEWLDVTAGLLKELIKNADNTIIAVGTTSLRTLESLYWMGVKTILFPEIAAEELGVRQWEVYEHPLAGVSITASAALQALLQWMNKNNHKNLVAKTQILIAPGYKFKIIKALVTNFHQPQSTLLLLVAAAIGNNWKSMYDYALQNNFRFLSYGDGSLIFINQF